MKNHECPACGELGLIERRHHETFDLEGKIYGYCSLCTECTVCGFEFVDAEQSKANKRAAVAARSAASGLPSTATLRNWRKKWGLSQKEAGRLLGVGPTAFSKYENDELAPSAPTARLLYLVTHSDIAVQKLAARYDIDLPLDALEASAVVSRQHVDAGERVNERMKHLAHGLEASSTSATPPCKWSVSALKSPSAQKRKRYEITPEGLGI